MPIQMSSCRVAVLFLVALVSGCSSISPGASGKSLTSTRIEDECKSNRGRCLYEGQYEPEERDYAEQEAKRLNLAQYELLRRNFGK